MNVRLLIKASVLLIWSIAVVAFWLFLAPKQLGGRHLYVIVTGHSMEPSLRDGDLALVSPSNKYDIGDVIVYNQPKLGAVIHRIVGFEGSRYIIRGDHNDQTDPYHPTRAEIQGKVWFHLAFTGIVMETFHTPVGAALLAGFIGFFLFWPNRELQEVR